MKLDLSLRHLPMRLATGAFILSSGLNKRSASKETATRLHGFAAGAYPALEGLEAEKFASLLSAGEIAVGAALLLPVVPPALAGAALTGFSSALVGLYLRTPAMRSPGSIRPSEQGIALAKDSWMLGIGLSLLFDGLSRRR
ncbi:MAG: hypothetical protein ACRDYD_14105 [Acidimicrobiales bacterium]